MTRSVNFLSFSWLACSDDGARLGENGSDIFAYIDPSQCDCGVVTRGCVNILFEIENLMVFRALLQWDEDGSRLVTYNNFVVGREGRIFIHSLIESLDICVLAVCSWWSDVLCSGILKNSYEMISVIPYTYTLEECKSLVEKPVGLVWVCVRAAKKLKCW